MKPRSIFLMMLALAVFISVAPPLPARAASADLKIGGTGSGLELMNILARAYGKTHPDVTVSIVPSLGSSGGIKALLNGALDLSISSRPLKEDEIRQGGRGEVFARTPFAFIAHPRGETQSLTPAEVEKIYRGENLSWPDGTPLRLVLRPATESDNAIVKSLTPTMSASVDFALGRKGMIVALSDQDSAGAVERIIGAFGGATLCQILTEQRQVKVLSLNGIAPGVKEISDGSYPLVKSLYLVTSAQKSPVVREFLAFIDSPEGRRILESYASLPVAGEEGEEHE